MGGSTPKRNIVVKMSSLKHANVTPSGKGAIEGGVSLSPGHGRQRKYTTARGKSVNARRAIRIIDREVVRVSASSRPMATQMREAVRELSSIVSLGDIELGGDGNCLSRPKGDELGISLELSSGNGDSFILFLLVVIE